MTQCQCQPSAGTRRTAEEGFIGLYRRMPPMGEPERIHSLLLPHSSVLELGAGTGRIADPLAQLGHHVTAVDDSELLLADIRHARPVCARIEDLQLAEKFDAVLLMTNLIHYRGADLRRAVLAATARHLKTTGKAVIDWKPPSYWAARPSGWTESKKIGDAAARVIIHKNLDGLIDGEYTLIADETELRQCFHSEVITLEELEDELDRAGLALLTAAPESTDWLEVILNR